MSQIKQVIVVRTKYPDGNGGTFKPRTGKLMAQVAHASMKFLVDELISDSDDGRFYNYLFVASAVEREWLEGAFTKVVVQVESEEELRAVIEAGKTAGLVVKEIIDNGMTEFHGVPTLTCAAFGPDTHERLHPVTGHLKLL